VRNGRELVVAAAAHFAQMHALSRAASGMLARASPEISALMHQHAAASRPAWMAQPFGAPHSGQRLGSGAAGMFRECT
jgi:hypothetical protein